MLGSFAWKVVVCTTKVRDELLEMGKDLKVKHSVPLPPTKYGGTFFIKKLCMGEQTFLGKGLGGCFTWEPMIRSFKVEVNGCKARVKLFFPLIEPDLGYWCIIWKVNITDRWLNLKNTFYTLYLWGWVFLLF